jgi:DNA-binding MarR family transcriptional regulator
VPSVDRERLAGNLLAFVPSVFKRLVKGYPVGDISRQQLEFLFMLSGHDGNPMSFYSEKLMVSKPNLTVMTDKLIEEGFVKRSFDPNDRRVIILNITDKGQESLCRHKEKVRQEMVKKLGQFNESDVKRLNELIEEMRAIFDKVDQDKQP